MSDPDEFAPPKGQFQIARPPPGGIPAPVVIPIPTDPDSSAPQDPGSTRVPGDATRHPSTGQFNRPNNRTK